MKSVFKDPWTHQAIDESHAQSVGSLVQLHYKHHTQVISKGRGARGGYREGKLTPTNTPCRGHGHPQTQHTHTHKTHRVAIWGWTNTRYFCAEDKRTHTDTEAHATCYRHTHTHMCFWREPADVTLATLKVSSEAELADPLLHIGQLRWEFYAVCVYCVLMGDGAAIQRTVMKCTSKLISSQSRDWRTWNTVQLVRAAAVVTAQTNQGLTVPCITINLMSSLDREI